MLAIHRLTSRTRIRSWLPKAIVVIVADIAWDLLNRDRYAQLWVISIKAHAHFLSWTCWTKAAWESAPAVLSTRPAREAEGACVCEGRSNAYVYSVAASIDPLILLMSVTDFDVSVRVDGGAWG